MSAVLTVKDVCYNTDEWWVANCKFFVNLNLNIGPCLAIDGLFGWNGCYHNCIDSTPFAN